MSMTEKGKRGGSLKWTRQSDENTGVRNVRESDTNVPGTKICVQEDSSADSVFCAKESKRAPSKWSSDTIKSDFPQDEEGISGNEHPRVGRRHSWNKLQNRRQRDARELTCRTSSLKETSNQAKWKRMRLRSDSEVDNLTGVLFDTALSTVNGASRVHEQTRKESLKRKKSTERSQKVSVSACVGIS